MTVVTISDTRAQPTEHAAPVMVWERCVLAPHDFLTEADIVFWYFRPTRAIYS